MSAYMPTSKSDSHVTPERVFEIIQNRWGYTKEQFFDPCPIGATNGLEIIWKKLNFVNPPYGIKKGKALSLLELFVHKAVDEAEKFGSKTIMLLPCKTDQDWFHDYIKHRPIEWISKRLHFTNNKWGATQPHFLVLIE